MRQTAKIYKSAMMRLAFYSCRLRFAIEGMGGDWSILGAELVDDDGIIHIASTEDEYRESLGISRSNFYKYMRIGEVLSNLSLTDMEQIRVTNAELLMQVDPALMQDFPWVQEAKQLTTDSFAVLVATRNRQTGKDNEPKLYFRAKVPATAKRFLDETVEAFRVEHGLHSSGEALEMLIADVHDRPNAMTTMHTAAQLVEWAMGRVKKRDPESQEAIWLERAFHMLRRTYTAVRMESTDEDNAQEVYAAEEIYERKSRPTGEGIVSTKPYGAGGPSVAGHADMEGTGFYLHPLQEPDGADRDGDGFEDGGEG